MRGFSHWCTEAPRAHGILGNSGALRGTFQSIRFSTNDAFWNISINMKAYVLKENFSKGFLISTFTKELLDKSKICFNGIYWRFIEASSDKVNYRSISVQDLNYFNRNSLGIYRRPFWQGYSSIRTLIIQDWFVKRFLN